MELKKNYMKINYIQQIDYNQIIELNRDLLSIPTRETLISIALTQICQKQQEIVQKMNEIIEKINDVLPTAVNKAVLQETILNPVITDRNSTANPKWEKISDENIKSKFYS